ncbi:MAG: hypothetical protein J6Y20_01280 [Lachnospiraceae bacterium]|nr:hypothetical protein [Lachnospiraceae bacterium]
MNYNDTFPTVTTVKNPPDPISAPDTVKEFMCMTDERLCEAGRVSEAILEELRGPRAEKAENARDSSCIINAAKYNVDLADRLCMNLKEIADIIGVYA